MPREFEWLGGCARLDEGDVVWWLGRRAALTLVLRGRGRAASILEQQRVLARLTASPNAPYITSALLADIGVHELARALERGDLVLRGEPRERLHLDPRIELPPRPPPPIDDEPFEISDRSLLIVACPPRHAPRRGPLTITYLLRELAGRRVMLSLRCASYPGGLLFEHLLEPGECSDGRHDFAWDCVIAEGPDAGHPVTPAHSPIEVELRHDDSYRDQARVEILPPTIGVLALGDINFSRGRAVLLPGPSREGEAAGDRADGIALIAGLLAHLHGLGEPRRVLVVGHTDARGSTESNLELSRRRALGVQLVLVGDHAGFAAHALEHAEVGDAQEVLRWVALRFGWPCDPGPIDGVAGARTSNARASFRARFEHELGEAAGAGASFDRADWHAFARLYELDLAARLGLRPQQLAQRRKLLHFTDPSLLACGEAWPNDALPRGLDCRDDRRVELLVLHPAELPDTIGGDDPPGAAIHAPGHYVWEAIAPGPRPHPLEGPCFELALALEDRDLVDPEAVLRLYGGPYDLRVAVADAHWEAGSLHFHYHGIATGVRYAIDYEDGQTTLTLARELDLDALIDTLADPTASAWTGFLARLPLRESEASGDESRDDGEIEVRT